jgi:hypothetical protein
VYNCTIAALVINAQHDCRIEMNMHEVDVQSQRLDVCLIHIHMQSGVGLLHYQSLKSACGATWRVMTFNPQTLGKGTSFCKIKNKIVQWKNEMP